MNLRVPRTGEVVAATLRRMILNGELKDGDRLPRQEDLLRMFNVSHPSLREGLRVLEAEGIITIQRGNVGGASVRVPKASGIAYSFGMVLQAEQVPWQDLANALNALEPVCFGLASALPDRAEVLVPRLEESCEKLGDLVSDDIEFTRAAREFHQIVVDNCGNATIRMAIGALTKLWSYHEETAISMRRQTGRRIPEAKRREVLKTHVLLTRRIAEGSVEQCQQLAALHLRCAQPYVLAVDEHDAVIALDAFPSSNRTAE
jgi:GntR family transcriptional regulator, transcriptional repressor for pyruvate dehydrogenase complex